MLVNAAKIKFEFLFTGENRDNGGRCKHLFILNMI